MPERPPFDILVLPTPDGLADAAAERFTVAAGEAVRSHGSFIVALSGGTTPQRLYERLAAPPYAAAVPWSRVTVLWGDERRVPPDDAASNYRMAREALLDHVPIPAANVHRIRGEDSPAAAANGYERTLRGVLGTPHGPPRTAPGARIDLVLLGLGEDGHTASLFPGAMIVAPADASAADGDERWVVAGRLGAAGAAAGSPWRVTLTPGIFNAAAEILFLVAGEAKAAIVRRVLEGPRMPDALPAQRIAPTDGRLLWLLDAGAAHDLTGHDLTGHASRAREHG